MEIQRIDSDAGVITTDDGLTYPIGSVLNPGNDQKLQEVKRKYDAISSVGPAPAPEGGYARDFGTGMGIIGEGAMSVAKSVSRAALPPQEAGEIMGVRRTPAAVIPQKSGQQTDTASAEVPPVIGSSQPTPPTLIRQSVGGARPLGTFGQLEAQRSQAVRDYGETEANRLAEAGVTEAQIGQVRAERSDELRAQQQRMADIEAEKQKRVAEENAKLTALEKDYANTKIRDPWASRNTGTTIMQAIAVGLGQFAASRGGGQNAALNIIQSQIDSDLRVQEANLQRKGAVLANARGALARTREVYTDKTSALLAADILSKERVAQDIQMLRDQGLSKDKDQAAQSLQDQLRISELDRKEQLFLAEQEARNRAATAAAQKQAEREKEERIIRDFERSETIGAKTMAQVALEKDGPTKLVNINSRLYQARNNEEAKLLREKATAADSFAAGLDDIQKYYEKTGVLERATGKVLRKLNDDERMFAEAKYDNLINKYARFLSPGIVTESDKRDARQTIPNPTNAVSFGIHGAYAGLKSQMNQELVSATKGMYRVINPREGVTPRQTGGLQFGPRVK